MVVVAAVSTIPFASFVVIFVIAVPIAFPHRNNAFAETTAGLFAFALLELLMTKFYKKNP